MALQRVGVGVGECVCTQSLARLTALPLCPFTKCSVRRGQKGGEGQSRENKLPCVPSLEPAGTAHRGGSWEGRRLSVRRQKEQGDGPRQSLSEVFSKEVGPGESNSWDRLDGPVPGASGLQTGLSLLELPPGLCEQSQDSGQVQNSPGKKAPNALPGAPLGK